MPIHVSSLIPKMSVFNLAISCLTTSNLPWFMYLIFQVSMQYCFLQYPSLLSQADIHNSVSFLLWPSSFILSGAISNCTLLFLSSIWDTSWPRRLIFGVIFFFFFLFLPWASPGKNIGVGYYFLLQWTTFCQNSSLWSVCLGWLCMPQLIAELCKPLHHDKVVIHAAALRPSEFIHILAESLYPWIYVFSYTLPQLVL